MTTFDIIFYHSPCSDGMCGAWCIWRKNKDAKLIPCSYGKNNFNLDDLVSKKIAIVDFSFDKQTLTNMANEADSIVLLDHHKSAERELKDLDLPNVKIIFDMTRSGAQLAWDYMYDNDNRFWFVEMVADRDLWKWELPWSKAVGRSTYELEYHNSVEKIEELYAKYPEYTESLFFLEFGNQLLKKEEKEILKYTEKPTFCHFNSKEKLYTVAVANPPYHLRSEVGNRIANKFPVDFVVMYQYVFSQDETWLSFRASDKSDLDLSKLAKDLFPNGGGHPKASGATLYGEHSENKGNYLVQDMFDYFTPLTKEELDKFLNLPKPT